jgi:bifunctional non-homologous end joining protein LigD
VAIAVWGGDALRPVGKVTIPPNYDVPKVGDLVEVRYLYVGSRGALYQPVYQGVRTDKDGPDTYASLKQKTNDDDDDN